MVVFPKSVWISHFSHRNYTVQRQISILVIFNLFTTWSRFLKPTFFSSSQEILRILWSPKFHYHIHYCPPLAPILSHIDIVQALTSHFLKIHSNIILPSMPGFSNWSLSLRFLNQISTYTSALPHTCYIPRPSHYRLDHPNSILWVVQIINIRIP